MIKFLFILFAFTTLLSSGLILVIKNIVHCALLLIIALVGVSAIFILSGADFIGVAQILVYIGGVMVLLLFGIMLTRREQSEQYPQSKSQHIFKAILIAVFVSAILVWLQSTLIKQSNLLPNQANELPSIEIIGELLLGRNLIMFEIAGFLLTVALIGASLIAASSQETNN